MPVLSVAKCSRYWEYSCGFAPSGDEQPGPNLVVSNVLVARGIEMDQDAKESESLPRRRRPVQIARKHIHAVAGAAAIA